MNFFRFGRRTAPASRPRGSNFFVDSIGVPDWQEPLDTGRRLSEALIFAIALATALGAAGLFGLLQLVGVTGS